MHLGLNFIEIYGILSQSEGNDTDRKIMTLKSLNFSLLVVNIDNEDLSLLSEELNKKRMTAPAFFENSPIVVNITDDTLEYDFKELKKIVDEQQFILTGVSGVESESQKELLALQNIALLRGSKRTSKQQTSTTPVQKDAEPTVLVDHEELKTKIHIGRVRSGQQIYARECDLIINGDVAHGAEVIADGNIHIYGTLRGRALAGAMGSKNVFIFCQVLQPELVSVAGVYKLSDDLPANFVGKGSIISLENEKIVLAKLSQT